MPTPERAPDGPFCMNCGPGATLEAFPQAHVLRCPKCGAEERLPALPLFVVTGASGAGKTAIVEPPRERLPDFEVLDIDTILHVAALGWDAFRSTWLQLAHAVGLNGRSVILCGSLIPDHLDRLLTRRLVGPVHFCNLDCSDATLAERLRDRPAWRGWSATKIADHQRFAAWLRTHIETTIDTTVDDPGTTADRIADWIRQQDHAGD